ncbi:unnamed protein product [Urochloa humidicola]
MRPPASVASARRRKRSTAGLLIYGTRARDARAAAEEDPGISCKRRTSPQCHGDDGGPGRRVADRRRAATVPYLSLIAGHRLEDRRATSTGRARKPHAASPRKPAGSGAGLEEDDGRL